MVQGIFIIEKLTFNRLKVTGKSGWTTYQLTGKILSKVIKPHHFVSTHLVLFLS